MESTGVKGKIQVSESTAALLRKSKKAHWLKPRQDLIQVKGKGMMQTFFLDPQSSPSVDTDAASQKMTTSQYHESSSVKEGGVECAPEEDLEKRLMSRMSR